MGEEDKGFQPTDEQKQEQETFDAMTPKQQKEAADAAHDEANFVMGEIKQPVSELDATKKFAEKIGDQETVNRLDQEYQELMNVSFAELPKEFQEKMRGITEALREAIKKGSDPDVPNREQEVSVPRLSINEEEYLAAKIGTKRKQGDGVWPDGVRSVNRILVPLGVMNPSEREKKEGQYLDYCYIRNNVNATVIAVDVVPVSYPKSPEQERRIQIEDEEYKKDLAASWAVPGMEPAG